MVGKAFHSSIFGSEEFQVVLNCIVTCHGKFDCKMFFFFKQEVITSITTFFYSALKTIKDNRIIYRGKKICMT